MESYSLEYFDRIFGSRGPAFWELVQALEDELGAYAAELGPLLERRDLEAVARLRHAHRPLVENLRLTSVQAQEAEIRRALETRAPAEQLRTLGREFGSTAENLVRELAEQRSRTGF